MRSIFLEKPDPLELRVHVSSVRGKIWVWLPVLLAIMVILAESTDTFSSEHTSGWLRPMIERLFGHMVENAWERYHHDIRKTGHFCGYGMVCLTFLRAWLISFGRLPELGRRAWLWRSSMTAVTCTAFVASMDEWHQTFIPSRTGTVMDVLLDSTGAAVTCGLVWFFFWRRQRTVPRLP